MHTVVVSLIADQTIEIPGRVIIEGMLTASKGVTKTVNVHDIRSIKVRGHRIVNVYLEPESSEEARRLGLVKSGWLFGDDEEGL